MRHLDLPLWLALLGAASCVSAPKVFASPQVAVQTLLESATDRAAADEALGDGGYEALAAGDLVLDDDVAAAHALCDEALEFAPDADGRVVALLGRERWPLPMPLVETRNGWSFDLEAGRREIDSRRIGRNELLTIATLRACVEAQHEARAKNASFKDRLESRDGRRDGLHWPEQDGPGSFVGPLLAAAEQPWGEPEFLATPFHGYFYRVLDRQGPQAPGGVRSYRADAGALQRGFALLAWPAEYGKSGISTFLVDQHGIVLERDLGRDTKAQAAAMLAFDPGEDWRPTDA